MGAGNKISLVEAPWILYRCMRDPVIPGRVKLLVVLLLAYILSPIDLVPDFVPVLGLLDEAIIIPLVLRRIFRMIPPERLTAYREDRTTVHNRGLSLLGTFIRTYLKIPREPRCSSLIGNNPITFLAPCPAPQSPPSRPRGILR